MKKVFLVLALLAGLWGSEAMAANQAGDRLINAGKEGRVFDYRPFLVPGKINIVDFYSQYCPPCRQIMPLLKRMTVKDANVVVLRVDINRPGIQGIDFTSDVAQQYHLQVIPAFKVYNSHGKLMGEGDDGAQIVLKMLAKHNIGL